MPNKTKKKQNKTKQNKTKHRKLSRIYFEKRTNAGRIRWILKLILWWRGWRRLYWYWWWWWGHEWHGWSFVSVAISIRILIILILMRIRILLILRMLLLLFGADRSLADTFASTPLAAAAVSVTSILDGIGIGSIWRRAIMVPVRWCSGGGKRRRVIIFVGRRTRTVLRRR